jgi:OmpA-OmpF porin, OOP family
MPSSEHRALGLAAVLLAANTVAANAEAQQQPEGFALDRLYPSAPGGGWFVMDDLDLRGGLGGAISMSAGYAHSPLRLADGSEHLTVVSAQASADFGFAATYDRWRLYLNLDAPLVTKGQSGTVADYQFATQTLDLGVSPDSLSDARIGFDARVFGSAKSAFRLGAGAQLIVPNGNRYEKDADGTIHANYGTDGTYRAMGRVLFAGDVGLFTYAGQVGVHVRPLDDSPAPGSPQGSECLFGLAGGARVPLRALGTAALVVGPEIYGATAFRSFFSSTGTALEGLLTGRIEGTADDGPQMRLKLGAGAGINPQFGAPEWRLVFAIELFDHGTDRDEDGISDSKDACPDVPGIRTHDPKTNGCPAEPAR